VAAYLWNYTSGFAEVAMTNVSGKKFSKTLTGQTAGAVIKIACKFAYAGGMVVTKQFSYTVGNSCAETAIGKVISSEQFFYPNPIQNVLHITMDNENNRLMLFDIVGNKVIDQGISSNYTLNTTSLKSGIYFIKVENTRGIYTGKVIKK